MPKFIDLSGKRYGKLVVLERAENRGKHTMWKCKCDCGNYTIAGAYEIKNGTTKSCGCQRVESAHNTHFRDLEGLIFGKLVVIERAENRKEKTMWRCRCECGNYTVTGSNELISGITKSCGCLKFESRNSTHKLSKTRLHNIWSKMKARCLKEKNPAYKWYGGRGITICQEWLDDFMNFYNWAMGNGYKDELSIDRIDVNGNYEPSNCRWIPLNEQALNTRSTKFLTYKGETKTVSEWCCITGMKQTTLLNRIRIGYSPEECFEVPLCSRRGKKKHI